MKTFNLKSINEGNVSFRCCPQVETVIGAESCAGLTVSQEPTMVMQKTAAGRDGNWSGNKRGSYRLSKSATGRDGNWGGNKRGSYRLSRVANTTIDNVQRDGKRHPDGNANYRLYRITNHLRRIAAAVLCLLTLGTGQMWGVTFTGGKIYFRNDVTNWTTSNIQIFAHQSGYTWVSSSMSAVSNTKLYYVNASCNWGGFVSYRICGNSSTWGSGSFTNQNGSTKYTGANSSYDMNSGSIYLITPANANNGCSISPAYYSSNSNFLTYTATAKVKTSTDGSSYTTVSSGTWPATVNIKGTYLSGDGATTRSDAATNSGASGTYTAVATGLITMTYSSLSSDYAFAGWGTGNTPSSTSSSYEYNIGAATTVYAFFKKKYTVTFNANGHGTAPSSQTVAAGEKATTPTAPTATGYTFGGWYKEAECTNAWNFSSDVVTGSTTLYAKWTEKMSTISLVASPSGKGTFTVGGSTVTSTTAGVATTRSVTAVPTTGYKFTGWSITGGASISSTSTNPTTVTGAGAAAILTATFEEDITYYTFKYGIHSGNTSYGTASATSGGSTLSSGTQYTYVSGTSITLTATATDADYKFEGWYNAWTGGSISSTDNPYTLSLSANTLAYAGFVQKSTTITLNNTANGGSGGTTSKSINHGASMSGLTAPGKSGYTFTGWWTAQTGGSKVIAADGTLVASVSVGGVAYTTSGKKWDYDDDALILYAQYTENMTTVTINVSPTGAGTLTVGGSAFTAGNTTTAGKTTSRTVVATAGSDYVFNNWTVSGEATGTASTNTYTLKGSGNGSTGTLTANFTVVPCTLYYGSSTPLNSPSSTAMSYDATTKAYYKDVTTNSSPYYFRFLRDSKQWSGNWNGNYPGVNTVSGNGTKVDCATDVSGWENKASLKYEGANGSSIRIWFDFQNKKSWITETTYTVSVSAGANGSVSPSSVTGVGASIASSDITATANKGYVFTGWTLPSGVTAASGYSASSNPIRINATAANKTITANFTAATAFIEGRFHVTNESRNGTWTNTFSTGNWNENSTAIKFTWDATNQRYYLKTNATPKELSTQISNFDPYFYIKKSSSSSSLANVVSYWSASSQTLTTAGYATGKKALTSTGTLSNANLRFNSTDESGYVIIYFDESYIWYEYEPKVTLTSSKVSIKEGTDASFTLTATPSHLVSGTGDVEYKFFNGNSTVEANRISTVTKTAANNTQAATCTVTPTYDSSTSSWTYTVQMTYQGQTKTATVTVYRKWDIYVNDVCSWGAMKLYIWDAELNHPVDFPGTTMPNVSGFTNWYTVELDSRYPNFLLDKGDNSGQSNDHTATIATYPKNTYWYLNNCKTLTQLTVTDPTVTLATPVIVNTHQITLTGTVTNFGGDGSTAAGLKEVGFYVGSTKYTASCTDGATFTKTITGLTAGTAYTVKAFATNIKGTGETTTQTATTRASGTYTIKVRASSQPKIHAWTEGNSCGGVLEENANYTSTGGANMTSTGIVSAQGTWWEYTMSNDYNQFTITVGANKSAWDSNCTAAQTAPMEDKCYWYWNATEKSSHGGQTLGEMTCPYLTPQLMIETTAGSGTYAYNEMTANGGNVEKTVTLTAETTYKFKVVYNSDYYTRTTSSDVVTGNNYSNIGFSVLDGENNETQIQTTVAGSYKFSFNTSTKKLTVTYPAMPTATPTISNNNTNFVKTTPTGSTLVGAGTSASPYLIFAGKEIKMVASFSSTPSNSDHLYFEFTKSGTSQGESASAWASATSAQKQLNFTESTASETVKYVSVKAYYKYNGIEGTKTESDKIYYKVVACPTVSLSDVPQEYGGPAANINSPFPITTTSTNVSLTGTSAATYKYDWSRTTGSPTSGNIRSAQTTIPTELDLSSQSATPDWYTITVTMQYGGSSFTANISLNLYNVYYVTIFDPHGWFNHIYAYGNNGAIYNAAYPGETKNTCCEQLLSGFEQGGNTYDVYGFQFKYPMWTHIVINDNANDSYKTANIAITSNCCVYLSTANNWGHTLTQDCSPDFYRVKSVAGDNIYYSNVVNTDGGIMSYYASNSGTLTLQKLNNGWQTVQNIARPSESYVYTAALNLAGNSVSTPQKYTDEFYLFGSSCRGQNSSCSADSTGRRMALPVEWSNATAEQRSRAQFTAFEPNPLYPNENYDHYWVEWLCVGQDVRCSLGNRYNSAIAPMLNEDKYVPTGLIVTRPSGLSIDIQGANVRFAYNPATNLFTRTLIYGSSAGVNFLAVPSAENVYMEDASGNKSATVPSAANPIVFNDLSNWQYQADMWATKSSGVVPKIVLLAPYNNQDQYPFGIDDSTVPPTAIKAPLLGTSTTAGDYHVRVIYDFKTNRIITGWLPADEENISSSITLDANMIVMRHENEDAAQISMTTASAEVIEIQQIYTVLEVETNNSGSWRSKHNGGFYWMSLPYDCAINEIFGLDGAYKSKWEIQIYRGDLRAKKGFWAETNTFWQVPPASWTIPANQGFVVYLKLEDSDFKSVEVNGVDKYLLRLYFPSKPQMKNTITRSTATTTVDAHPCTIERNGRKYKDSNWEVMGVPAFHNMTLASGDPSTLDPNPIYPTYNYPNFFYAWSYNGGSPTYTPQDATGTDLFHGTFSYMVQYGGTVTWSGAYSANVQTVKSVAARRAEEAVAMRKMDLQLLPAQPTETTDDDQFLDRTFVWLREGATADYDINYDLGKMQPAGLKSEKPGASLYSVGAFGQAPDENGAMQPVHAEFAAQNVPVEDQVIPLGYTLVKGDYKLTIANREQLNGIVPMLYDRLEDRKVNLLFDDYLFHTDSVEMTENRFELQLTVTTPTMPTDDERTVRPSDYVVSQQDGQLFISGIDGKAGVQMFDATGKLMFRRDIYAGEIIPAPAAGVYIMRINGVSQRIVVTE